MLILKRYPILIFCVLDFLGLSLRLDIKEVFKDNKDGNFFFDLRNIETKRPKVFFFRECKTSKKSR